VASATRTAPASSAHHRLDGKVALEPRFNRIAMLRALAVTDSAAGRYAQMMRLCYGLLCWSIFRKSGYRFSVRKCDKRKKLEHIHFQQK
jgi:hypothetical protein